MSAGDTIVLERNRRVVMASPARLVGPTEMTREQAWAEGLIRANPLYAWVMGSFVGAETPNANGHKFRTEHLRANTSLLNAPLNMLHRPHQILGSYVGAELVYPIAAAAAAGPGAGLPFVESLANMWRYYFQEEYASIKVFHEAGLLAQSMECLPKSLTCDTAGCGLEFAYAGRMDASYCDHLNSNGSPPRWLNHPQFSAGALVVPPAIPAWRGAQVTEVTAARREQLRSAEDEGLAVELYAQVAQALPNLSENDREAVMALLMAKSGPPEKKKPKGKGGWVPPWEKDKEKDADDGKDKADQPHAHQDVDPEAVDSPCKICGRDADSPIHQGMGNGLDRGTVEDGTAAMVALVPPSAVARALAVGAGFADALPVSELHVTLAYLGPEAVVELDRAAVEAVVGGFASTAAPMTGQIAGVGRFSAGYPAGQEKWPLYASVDVPDLPEFRQALVEALTAAGLPYARNHGFTPHMTLAYVGPDDEAAAGAVLATGLPPTPLAFAEVVLAWGNDRTVFPLGEPQQAPAAAAQDLGARRDPVAGIVRSAHRRLAAVPIFDPVIGRSITGERRQQLRQMGAALPDGTFAVETVPDLRCALLAVSTSKTPAAAREHLRARARAMGATFVLPLDW